jgi:hypothetical protein
LLVQGVTEREAGPLPRATKMRGGDLLAQLFVLRQYMIELWNFDAVARTQGTQVLRELIGASVSAALIDELVNGVLEILTKVVRTQLN